MNTNRNNRRRGRGNRQQGGNGAQLNRIDSRARGNAPQMLDKYKKLAQDAQHNGDRVQMEYYLQFADHYFRVLNESRSRFEENRRGREERDDNSSFDDEDDDIEFDGDGQDEERESSRQPARLRPRRGRSCTASTRRRGATSWSRSRTI